MSHNHDSEPKSNTPVIAAIVVLALVYFGLLITGRIPGPSTEVASADSHGEHADHHEDDHGDADTHEVSLDSTGHAAHGNDAAHGGGHDIPHPLAVTPFVLLLGAIAVFPLLRATEHWWESNLHRFYVAAGLAVVTLLYYLATEGQSGVAHTLDHAILGEYVPFIVLLFSLYTISGGIRIQGDLAAHPSTNCVFLLVGGVLASFVGTTGAAMLLIRPLIETNNERKYVQHTVVFFIFVVCNCGGCLLPIGDPPLFLGYLQGVSFLWTMWNLWLPWILTNAALIGIYYCWDRFIAYPRETIKDIQRDETETRPLQITGLVPNIFLLLGVILCVALLDPNKSFFGMGNPPKYLREVLQLLLVAASLAFGSNLVRHANRFNYHAIIEVAALFIGIFICMQPALAILNEKGPELGINSPNKAFWATGFLSSFLDNAPTYLVFYKTAEASYAGESFAAAVANVGAEQNMLIGISLGAVFMGAMTYIGNGPNFMVRAISEEMGVKMPSFFGYMFYSAGVLLPVFALVAYLFLWSTG